MKIQPSPQEVSLKSSHSSSYTKNYQTSDLYLGAFLRARGLKLIDTRKEVKKVYFIFEDTGETQTLVKEFWSDGLVNIMTFKNALQDLKTIIFSL